MKTIYVHRATEDLHVDMTALRPLVDAFIDGRDTTSTKGGLVDVAEVLEA